MSKTSIEWTDATWNPVTGCSKVSEGCRNCYAERLWPRLRAMGNPAYKDRNFNDVACHPDRLDQPLKWKKPRRIFVNSMSDLFHDDVPFKFIIDVFSVMAEAWHHTFMVLTKRPERMKEILNSPTIMNDVWLQTTTGIGADKPIWPLPNVWLGVSVENQAAADERIPLLLQTPAAVRFISAEPLLDPVDLKSIWKICPECGSWEIYEPRGDTRYCDDCGADVPTPKVGIDWVIVGGESGPGARPMHPDWVRSLSDQCQAANVPFFFKQWGEWAVMPFNSSPKGKFGCWDRCSSSFNYGEGRNESIYPGTINMHRIGKMKAGRELDGRTWDELPEVKP